MSLIAEISARACPSARVRRQVAAAAASPPPRVLQVGAPARGARRQGRPSWRCSAAELGEIDPMTGELVAGSTMGSEAPDTVEAGGLTFAYRTAAVNQAAASLDKLPVLCLHGIGSCSYAYRNMLRLLGEAGHEAVAPDLIGHGGSSKPLDGSFDYSAEAYIAAIAAFVRAVGIKRPFALVVHGFVLGQYGMLYALEHADDVAKLVILNTPLALKAKLRPELAAYKALAFLRPKPDARFDAMNFNAAGSPYAMAYKDAQAYARPYEEDPAASAAIYKTMERVDFPALLRRVDEGYVSWRKPALLVFGTGDTFLDLSQALGWLESKRTCMRMTRGVEAKLGHAPHEDYAEAIHPAIQTFLQDGSG